MRLRVPGKSSPLSANSLSRLLHITKQVVDQTLVDLHAILRIPEDQTRPPRSITLHFRNFLDKDGCGDTNFLEDEKQAHRRLAKTKYQNLLIVANKLDSIMPYLIYISGPLHGIFPQSSRY
jgi:hypothetical protein